jgi:hypothetical protein
VQPVIDVKQWEKQAEDIASDEPGRESKNVKELRGEFRVSLRKSEAEKKAGPVSLELSKPLVVKDWTDLLS